MIDRADIFPLVEIALVAIKIFEKMPTLLAFVNLPPVGLFRHHRKAGFKRRRLRIDKVNAPLGPAAHRTRPRHGWLSLAERRAVHRGYPPAHADNFPSALARSAMA